MAETRTLVGNAVRCAARVVRLSFDRRLHLPRERIGLEASLPDGRTYVVFRESTCDAPPPRQPVTLAVWFHLGTIPPGARVRRWLFERLCLFNTLLFAGFDGFLVKLWMVNPHSSDYAGLYAWESVDEADRYGRYITAILRPLSQRGTVGYEILPDCTLVDCLARATGA